MERKCICGACIDINSQLCSECKQIYGTSSSEWPVWLREWIKSYQRELDQENLHRNFAIDEKAMVGKALENLNQKLSGDPDYFEFELDEWGNEIEPIDGFNYVDVDRITACEKHFERRLRAINNGYFKPKMLTGEKLEKARRARIETHLYEDRHKYGG